MVLNFDDHDQNTVPKPQYMPYNQNRLIGHNMLAEAINKIKPTDRPVLLDRLIESQFEVANKMLLLNDAATKDYCLGILDGIKTYERMSREKASEEYMFEP